MPDKKSWWNPKMLDVNSLGEFLGLTVYKKVLFCVGLEGEIYSWKTDSIQDVGQTYIHSWEAHFKLQKMSPLPKKSNIVKRNFRYKKLQNCKTWGVHNAEIGKWCFIALTPPLRYRVVFFTGPAQKSLPKMTKVWRALTWIFTFLVGILLSSVNNSHFFSIGWYQFRT